MHALRLAAYLVAAALSLAALAADAPPRPPGAPPPARPRADAPAAAALLFGGKLDLTTASVEDLAALPGIGPGRARRIAADRARRGPCRSVDDLARVPGIGPRTVELIGPFVTCAR